MKTRKFIYAIVASLSVMSAQSCLKEQADIFEQSSSERLQSFIDETRNILTSNESGWIMEYYPGTNQYYGGYAYHLNFTDTEVEATCELDPENSYKSFYKFTTDNGAVLSFDVNNPALHYFATPSSSEYEAKGGDFEFTITSVSPEKIGLRGKRSGNHYDLYPYNASVTPSEYMSQVVEMGDSMRAAIIEGMVGDTEVNGTVDFNNRRINFEYAVSADSTVVVAAPYMYTPKGLRLYSDTKVAGATFRDFMYHSDNNVLSNGSFTFYGKLPEDYADYSEFEGDFTLSMYNGRIKYNVTLVPNENKTGFIMKNLSSHFDVVLGYDKAQGRLTWNAQVVGTEGNLTIWLAAWSLTAGGNLTWDTEYGVTIHKDLKTGNFVFEDNHKTDMTIDSFILWSTNSAGASQGSFEGWGDYQYPYLETLIRK